MSFHISLWSSLRDIPNFATSLTTSHPKFAMYNGGQEYNPYRDRRHGRYARNERGLEYTHAEHRRVDYDRPSSRHGEAPYDYYDDTEMPKSSRYASKFDRNSVNPPVSTSTVMMQNIHEQVRQGELEAMLAGMGLPWLKWPALRLITYPGSSKYS